MDPSWEMDSRIYPNLWRKQMSKLLKGMNFTSPWKKNPKKTMGLAYLPTLIPLKTINQTNINIPCTYQSHGSYGPMGTNPSFSTNFAQPLPQHQAPARPPSPKRSDGSGSRSRFVPDEVGFWFSCLPGWGGEWEAGDAVLFCYTPVN